MTSLFFHKVAIMLFDAEGRLLLAKDTDTGFWMTVGGAIEPDENLRMQLCGDAAKKQVCLFN